MDKIKLDKRNYRKHNDKNLELIEKSLKECGAGRSILIDNENTVIAGNGCLSQAEKLNIPVKVIETDGTELIAIKRTDLNTDDAKRKQLAIMDNSTSDSSDFDITLLQEDFDISDLSDWGVDIIETINNDDIEVIDEYNEGYNIIVKCENYDIAQEFNQKYNLNLNFDSQRIMINVDKLL